MCQHDDQHEEFMKERKGIKDLIDASGPATAKSVIEKLTAPPESVREHLQRIGVPYFIQHDIIRGRELLVVDVARLDAAEGE